MCGFNGANPRFAMAYNIPAAVYILKGKFDRSRDDVDKERDLGYPAFLEFFKSLQEASGTKR
jgi:hypothetical protein